MDYLLIAGGLVLLFLGGEGLVRGAVAIARSLGLSALLIGLTVVGFGTSMPELLVSIKANLDGAGSIAIGNVIGSNIANILLIIGVSALILPMTGWQESVRRDAGVMMLTAVAVVGLMQFGLLDRFMGTAMVAALLLYLGFAYRLEKAEAAATRNHAPHTAHEQEAEEMEDVKLAGWKAWLVALAGLHMLILRPDLLVTGAVNIARAVGISEAVIGLTIVAVGTSLPELATSIVAAIRRHADVAIGNVVGSNIFNVLGILGVTALVRPIPVEPAFRFVDGPLMIGVTALLALLLFRTRSIGRFAGVLMLGAYSSYTGYLFLLS